RSLSFTFSLPGAFGRLAMTSSSLSPLETGGTTSKTTSDNGSQRSERNMGCLLEKSLGHLSITWAFRNARVQENPSPGHLGLVTLRRMQWLGWLWRRLTDATASPLWRRSASATATRLRDITLLRTDKRIGER